MSHCVSSEAEADFDAIWYYIAKESGSVEVAERLLSSLTDRFYLLTLNPYIGRRRDDDLRPGIRSFPVGEYVILYRITDGNALILHVVQGSRSIEALFRS